MPVTPPVDLPTFKRFMHVAGTTLDTDLTAVLAEAAELVETAVGPMVVREITETVRDVACDGSFMLLTFPVAKDEDDLVVTALVDHFTAAVVDVATLDVDDRTGLVKGARSSRGYDVTYNVGRTEVPGPLIEATMVVAEQLWSSRQAPEGLSRFTQAGVGDPGQAPVYRGFAWPNRAAQLCAPYKLQWVA